MGRYLIVEARRRAGLSQRELADRMGTHQPVIARWESGRVEPRFASVQQAVRACGFELTMSVNPTDDHDLTLIKREMRLLPHERLSRMLEAVRALGAMEAIAGA